jgi:hypothetical protein
MTTQTNRSGLDNTNYDLVHALTVRAAAAWHERSYERETICEDCVAIFDRLRGMDQEAAAMLSAELAKHVRQNKFPIDITD